MPVGGLSRRQPPRTQGISLHMPLGTSAPLPFPQLGQPQKPPRPFIPTQLPSTCLPLPVPPCWQDHGTRWGSPGWGQPRRIGVQELPLPPTHSGLRAEPLPPGRGLGGLCSACGSVPAAAPRLHREEYGGTSGGGSSTSGRESICVSATASLREGVSRAPGKPLGRREARPGAGPVPQGRPAAILSSSPR